MTMVTNKTGVFGKTKRTRDACLKLGADWMTSLDQLAQLKAERTDCPEYRKAKTKRDACLSRWVQSVLYGLEPGSGSHCVVFATGKTGEIDSSLWVEHVA